MNRTRPMHSIGVAAALWLMVTVGHTQPAAPQPAPSFAPPGTYLQDGGVQNAPTASYPAGSYPAPPVVMMPPGYAEAPGQWPRKLPKSFDRAMPPAGYREAGEPIRALWITGLSVWAGFYGIPGLVGTGVAAGDNDATATLLLIPVLGPVIFSPVAAPLDSSDGRLLFSGMALLTLAQAAGVVMLVSGLALERPVFLRNDVIAIEPTVLPTGVGLQGTFL